jgi:hypothetical protein
MVIKIDRKPPAVRKVSLKKTDLSSVKGKIKKSLKAKCVKKVISPFCDSDVFTVTHIYPIITISEANTHEHWSKSSARHKKQKSIIKLYFRAAWAKPTLPCHMHIIRLSPRKLDYDNLTVSLKWIVDSLCEELTGDYQPGRADSDERISITYDQETSKEYGVTVIFDSNPYHFPGL